MCSIGIIWEVLKNSRVESLGVTHCNYLPHCFQISMKEAETPNLLIEEASFPHYSDYFVIEVNILKHP